MISNASKIAIKTLAYLAEQVGTDNKTRAQELAKTLDVPKPYLSKILQQLAAKGFVSSVKGPHGGFYLTHEQLDSTVMSVIIEVEGKDRFGLCMLSFEACNNAQPCAIHHLVYKEKEALRKQFGTITIGALN